MNTKNNKIKKQTSVKIQDSFWKSNSAKGCNQEDFELIARVEKATTNNPGYIWSKDGTAGFADVILTIKGNYDFDKHGFPIGGSNGPCEKIRVVIPHSLLEIIN